MKRACFWLAGLLVVTTLSVGASALEVRETIWGFGGQVMAHRFNPLSVLVINPTDTAFDGTLVLYKTKGMGGRVGAQLVEPCYIVPFGARWVQFYPFVDSVSEEWDLSWGKRSKEKAELPAPRFAPAARVLLFDPEDSLRRPTAMKQFPDVLFPPMVSATDALDSVVLDYVPRWEPARREAFLDWVRRGGTVHLLRDHAGNYLQFSGDLAALNSPLERIRVGAGLVVKHPISRSEMSNEWLEQHGFSLPMAKSEPVKKKPAPNAAQLYSSNYGFYLWDESLLRKLSDMTRPDHNWTLIYLLNVLYLVLIVPLNYHLAKRWRDYRRAIAFLLGSVICFGLIFSFVGRRGYGEATAVHTLSYARTLGDDSYDVSQWSNVFVTHGALYTLTHSSGHHLYSTAEDFETVNGQILNGKDGKFFVDIPIYSSRKFVHRGKMKGDATAVKIVTWGDGGAQKPPTLEMEKKFPSEVLGAWIVMGSDIWPMKLVKGRLETAGQKESTDDFFSPQNLDLDFQTSSTYGQRDQKGDRTETFRQMGRILMARSLGGDQPVTAVTNEEAPVTYQRVLGQEKKLPLRLLGDRAQLFIFARSPKSFEVQSKGLGKEVGYTLYHQYLFPPQ